MSGDVAWGDPSGGLRAGLEADGAVLRVILGNVGDAPLRVFSHVDAGDIHLDWYYVTLRGSTDDEHFLRLTDMRDESGWVVSELAPGENVSHRIDLVWWSRRSINEDAGIGPGRYDASVTYTVDPSDADLEHTWSGTISTGRVHVDLPPG